MEPVENIVEKLHRQNMRLTLPRRKALELFMSQDHMRTAGELHLLARKAGIAVGLTTIYRLLAALAAVGLAKPYMLNNSEIRYIFCSPGHHHHIICTRCGLFKEFFNCPLLPPSAEAEYFALEDHQLDYFGVCRNCQENCSIVQQGERGNEL